MKQRIWHEVVCRADLSVVEFRAPAKVYCRAWGLGDSILVYAPAAPRWLKLTPDEARRCLQTGRPLAPKLQDRIERHFWVHGKGELDESGAY